MMLNPQTMAGAPCFGAVNFLQVLYHPPGGAGAAPSVLLLPSALVKTENTTQTSSQTVRPLCLRGSDDAQVPETVDNGTQNITEAKGVSSEHTAPSCRGVDLSQHPALQTWLPPGYDYHVCWVEERPTLLDHSAVCAKLRLPLRTREEMTEWVMKTRSTPVTWRVLFTKPLKGQRVIVKRLASISGCCLSSLSPLLPFQSSRPLRPVQIQENIKHV